jgi:hypothetical protein
LQLRFACAAFADCTARLVGKEPVLVPVFGKVSIPAPARFAA